METHPRLKYFPWHIDYISQANIFAPNVVSVAKPGYRSRSLNIDAHGFRFQYDSSRHQIDLMTARDLYHGCDLVLGNSTSFGVSLSSDSKTLGHYLNSDGHPCINLSVRGATMQQELAIFLTYKHLLPKVRRIILLTGICDISLATQPADMWSEAVGGMHSTETFFKLHYAHIQRAETRPLLGKQAFLNWAEERYHKSSFLRKFFERDVQPKEEPCLDHGSVEKTVWHILSLMNSAVESWGWIARSSGIEIQLVLQPVLGWTTKPLSKIEQVCLDFDADRLPAIQYYANQKIYQHVKDSMKTFCQKQGVGFLDANTYLNTFGATDTLFTDICHLTDSGTQKLATWIR